MSTIFKSKYAKMMAVAVLLLSGLSQDLLASRTRAYDDWKGDRVSSRQVATRGEIVSYRSTTNSFDLSDDVPLSQKALNVAKRGGAMLGDFAGEMAFNMVQSYIFVGAIEYGLDLCTGIPGSNALVAHMIYRLTDTLFVKKAFHKQNSEDTIASRLIRGGSMLVADFIVKEVVDGIDFVAAVNGATAVSEMGKEAGKSGGWFFGSQVQAEIERHNVGVVRSTINYAKDKLWGVAQSGYIGSALVNSFYSLKSTGTSTVSKIKGWFGY
ncbi:hypothetical protein [Candidatus Nucleicultrix amoebiphila]|jgi:hypothetical protein|uniref:Secreted protein n=1 Tax=Candidatus Nucleicultrix amoebiphila FS5 TaxID=1414854 RepID=A0A1W6N3E4_9PROT|nr:hypothetical protein [Candidatus Nucleicultrix amoebiphila]ARN84417.1 hypothetical protein GQ61_02750 [Candidatus Nucleicultrix amoebiphila FS5]